MEKNGKLFKKQIIPNWVSSRQAINFKIIDQTEVKF